jgi:hypothetical protein
MLSAMGVSTFFVCSDRLQAILKAFHYPKQFNFLFASLPFIDCRKNTQEFSCHWWLPLSIFNIASLWSLKRVTGRIFKISK